MVGAWGKKISEPSRPCGSALIEQRSLPRGNLRACRSERGNGDRDRNATFGPVPGAGIAVRRHGRPLDGASGSEGDPRRGVGVDGPRRGRRARRRVRARDDGVRAAGAARLRRGRVPRAGGRGTSFVGVAGHSLGEFAALVAAGVVPFGDALDLVVVRGAAMQRAGEERPGTMTALLGVGAEDAAHVVRRGSPRRRARRRERELRRAVGDLRLGLRDRAGRGAREGTEGPRDPIARRRRVPLAADGTGARRDRRADRRDRVLAAAVPGRRERRRARWCPTRRSFGRC